MPKIINFGCRLNIYEGEVMRSQLAHHGDDVVVINSCAVTNEAERQARQAIRKARRDNANAKIIVTGCAAQTRPEQFSEMSEVDMVLGNIEKENIANFLLQNERVIVNDIMSIKETASHLVEGYSDHARAFVQVQNGCNHRCTFCIIPFGRGNSRSVAMGEVIQQIRLLVDKGYNEIVLTGVDISDYGKDLPIKSSLGILVQKILRLIPDLARLRLSSIDAVEVDDALKEVFSDERIMPHLHISLQAGDDMILKRMKRRHLRDDILKFCDEMREIRPDIVYGADIIAGFPTETDEMFANSAALIDEAGLTYLHIFPYSAKEGTPAAKMPQVEMKIRKERAKILREKGKAREEEYYKSLIGKSYKAIIEQDNLARTPHFAPIKVEGEYKIGSVHEVMIRDYLMGEVS